MFVFLHFSAFINSKEFDESLLTDLTMLEDLDIDLINIQRSCLFMVYHPWAYLQAYFRFNSVELVVAHPMSKSPKVDFWGPFAVVSSYCGILWMANVKNIPWIIVIWASFAFLSHLVARVSYQSTYILHATIFGYSVVPLIPYCVLLIVFNIAESLSFVIQVLVLSWSMLFVYVSFRELLCTKVNCSRRFFYICVFFLLICEVILYSVNFHLCVLLHTVFVFSCT